MDEMLVSGNSFAAAYTRHKHRHLLLLPLEQQPYAQGWS